MAVTNSETATESRIFRYYPSCWYHLYGATHVSQLLRTVSLESILIVNACKTLHLRVRLVIYAEIPHPVTLFRQGIDNH